MILELKSLLIIQHLLLQQEYISKTQITIKLLPVALIPPQSILMFIGQPIAMQILITMNMFLSIPTVVLDLSEPLPRHILILLGGPFLLRVLTEYKSEQSM